jgi:hypothetical protein
MTGIYIRFNIALLLLLPFLFPEDNSGVAAGRALRLPRRDALSRALKANSTLAASLDEPAAGAPPLPPPTLSPSGLRCEFKTVKRQKDKPVGTPGGAFRAVLAVVSEAPRELESDIC